jgi:hypothetical protein
MVLGLNGRPINTSPCFSWGLRAKLAVVMSVVNMKFRNTKCVMTELTHPFSFRAVTLVFNPVSNFFFKETAILLFHLSTTLYDVMCA